MSTPRTQRQSREFAGAPEKTALSAHVLDEIKELPAKYPQPRSAVMPALDLAQEELGHLTPEAMSEVADALQLDPGYVEGVATFYSLFHLAPIGKHRFYVCTNLSCMLRGASDIVDHVKQAIGVAGPDQVSADGLFSYEEVECLGACEYAPMMRLDHEYHYDLTTERIDALIADRRSLAAKPTARPHPPASPATSLASGEMKIPTPRPHPPASPATSPASGEVKIPTPRPRPPASPATSPASGEVKIPTPRPRPPASPATSPARGEVKTPTPRSHPPASPATSPASGEVKTPTPRSHPPASPATSPASGEVKTPTPRSHPPASPATSPASGEVKRPTPKRTPRPHPPASPTTSPASGEVKPRKKKVDG